MNRRDDGVQQVVDGTVTDQMFRQFRESVRRLAAALRLDPRGIQTRDDTRHGQHHDDVDGERRPVLRRADVECLVGRNVAVVVDEESGNDARNSGTDPSDG